MNWYKRFIFPAAVLASMTSTSPLAHGQNPPGCFSPRFTAGDQKLAESTVVAVEKRNPHSAELADALESLADKYRDFQPDKALAVLNRALSIRQALAGKKNATSPGDTLVKIADVYEYQGKYNEAMKQLDRADEIEKRDVRRTAGATIYQIMYHQCNCLLSAQSGEKSKGLQRSQALVTYSEKLYGANTAHTYQALSMLASAYRMNNKAQDANVAQKRMDTLMSKLGNPFSGEGTARRLNLDPLLAREDQQR